MNGIPGLILEHFYVKFGDPSCIGFWDIMWKKTNTGENPTPETAVGMGNYKNISH